MGTFGAGREPESNGARPRGFWETNRDRPREKLQQERAQRLPTDAQSPKRPRGTAKHRQVFRSDGLQEILIERGSEIAIPPRGAVSAPAKIDVDWLPADKRFPDEGVSLFRRYLDLIKFEECLVLGMSATAAGQLCDLAKSMAAEVAKELEAVGDSHGWLVSKAMAAIQGGKIPRGRETFPSSVATAFFLSLLGGYSPITIWLERIGYKVRLDATQLEDSLRDYEPYEQEAFEYMIMSHFLWELYP